MGNRQFFEIYCDDLGLEYDYVWSGDSFEDFTTYQAYIIFCDMQKRENNILHKTIKRIQSIIRR